MPELSIERIEQRCLSYLRQVKNPLVPIKNLLDYCQRDEACKSVEEAPLLQFLRNHGDIEVLDGPLPGEELGTELLGQAGIEMGIRVILKDRIPSRREMEVLLVSQVHTMQQELARALSDAIDAGNEERIPRLREALQRADAMRERVAEVMKGEEQKES